MPPYNVQLPHQKADIALIKRLIRESSDGSDGKNGGRGGGNGGR